MSDQLFYIQDTRTLVGNCVLWWRADGQGYTTDLTDAGKFREGDGYGSRETDVRWPVEIIDRIARPRVDFQALEHRERKVAP